ncbi:MAG: hypothetical protein WCP87_04785, partial [Atribacterota bacterium]
MKATYWQPWETVLEKLTTLQTRNQRTQEKKDALFLALNENSRHLQKTVENEKTLRDKLKTLEDYHYQLDTIVRPEVSTLLMLVRDRETWTKEKNRDEVILTGIRKTIEEEKKAWQVLNYHIDQGKGELSVLEKKLLALERIVRETESLYASLSLAEKEKTFFMKELENVQKGIERIQADRELARRTIEKLNQELEHRAIKREKMDVERKEQIRLFATIELQDTWKKTGVCPICGTHTLPDHLRFSHPGGINIIEAEKTHREFEEYWTHLMTEKEKNEEKEKMLSRSEEELTKTRINHQEKIRTLLEQQKGSRDSLQEVFQPLSFPHVPERGEIATLLENERRRKDALSSSIHTRERELSGSNEKRAALSEREKELSLALEERSQKITGADQLVQEKRTHITLLLQEMNLSLRTDFLPENAFQHYWERCLRSFNTASGEMTRTTSEIESLRAQITMQEKSLTELQNDINMCTNEVETLSAQEQALQSVFLQEVQKYGFSKESFLSLKDRQPGGWSERLNRMEGEWKQLQSREEELQKECSEFSSRLHVPLDEVETILLREKNSLEELQRDLAESRETAG